MAGKRRVYSTVTTFTSARPVTRQRVFKKCTRSSFIACAISSTTSYWGSEMKSHAMLLLWACLGLLSGCAPLLVAGVGTAAVAAHDRRSLGAFLDDQTIEMKAGSALRSDDELKRDTNINVTSLNGIVLMSGEAPTSELRARALAQMRDIGGIRRIVNEVRVAPIASFPSRSHDTWLTTKVKTKLIHT